MIRISIPPEITSFFESDWGRSLMIKGKAGTGKTILSLSMLEELGEIENSFYLSTRVANYSLYSQFPWLRQKEWRENLIDGSMEFLRVISKGEEAKKYKESKYKGMEKVDMAREMLAMMEKQEDSWAKRPKEHLSRNMLDSLDIDNELLELRDVYRRIEKRLPEKSLIIIDSLEALVERYDIDAKLLIKTLQKDLVEASGMNLVLVIEEEESTKWDYLVDGYITLKEREFEGKRVRHTYLNKLRGEKITKPVYLMTLDKGRFRYFKPNRNELPRISTKNLPIDDEDGKNYQVKNCFSTGSEELDKLLDFGLPKDCFVLLEIGETVRFPGKMKVLGPLMVNFLLKGRKVVNIPLTIREDTEVKSWLNDILEEESEKNLITFRPEDFYSLSGEEKFKDYRKRLKNVYKEALYRFDNPLLTVCELENIEDSLNYVLDDIDEESAGKILLDIMRDKSDLVVGVIRPGLKISQKLKNISDIHLRLFSEHNTLIFTGEKPKLGLHNVSMGEDIPKFIPLV